MLGLSPQEMLIVLVIGVLLFGKNLPNIGRTLGKGLMEFKKGLSDLKAEVDIASFTSGTPSTSSPTRVESRYNSEDFDEPTAPKFEPPTQAPTVAADPTLRMARLRMARRLVPQHPAMSCRVTRLEADGPVWKLPSGGEF